MATKKQKTDRPSGVIAFNRKARRNYTILETFEAGIVLLGTEVKSIRNSKVDLSAGFANIENNDLILNNIHIKLYEYGHQFNHEPRRPRRLLLHRREINRLIGKTVVKGLTLIPLSLYFNPRGKVKVELGLCRGKNLVDKRDTLRQKTAEREAERAISSRLYSGSH